MKLKIVFLLVFMIANLLAFRLTACADDGNPYSQITMTAQEAEELAQILALEAINEPYEGQCAVVEVIFNRVLSDQFPDTVHEVLSQRIGGKAQFSTWRYLNKPYAVPGELQDDVISDVLRSGPRVLPSTEYVFFDNRTWRWMRDNVKIGKQFFGR